MAPPIGVIVMIAKNMKKILSVALSLILATVSSQLLCGSQDQSSPPATGNPTETTPNTPAELQALVAPIALYPDSLVAQVLSAATFPDQVAVADYWLQQNKSLTGNALMQQVDKQSWDQSVKALTEFPSVLGDLAKNLTWTSSLGEAYHNQQAEVMTAIQTLRAQAKAAGNLKSSPQITVVQQSPQVIVIQPANPQIVYVPQYNPGLIYGTPYVVPGYSPGYVAAAGIIGFGAGIAVGALMSGGCCSWGYSSWNCGWHGSAAVVYHGGAYYGNSAWHGGYYNGGYHSGYGYNNAYNHYGNNYDNAYNHTNSANNYKNNGNTYNKNVSGNTVNVNKQNSQNFNSSRSSVSNSWAQHGSGSGAHSDAFSGMSGHSGGFGGSGGWSSMAESGRGWGSMHSSGFGGGRFGSGGGGFGGGGFGGFRGGGRR
jgi:hypothetical protein